MKRRRALRAVVTVQAAHVRGMRGAGLCARALVMVAKGEKNVTVPTNCATRVYGGEGPAVWDASFSIPVRRESDVLVFNVLRVGDGRGRERDGEEVEEESVGVCLLPMRGLGAGVCQRRLELFEDPESVLGVGFLYVAARLVEVEVDQWEKGDLLRGDVIRRFQESRLSPFNDRFIGIGELAAFLFVEGYSKEIDANWDRAVTILSEQLAYKIYQSSKSTADRANFRAAKAQVERDQGLWDGI